MTTSHFTALADRIDRLNTAIGRAASWCTLFIVLIGLAVVLMRYVLGSVRFGCRSRSSTRMRHCFCSRLPGR
jgi:TRAP-type mannitol/chloroaromatic compound transport system permease small subunit